MSEESQNPQQPGDDRKALVEIGVYSTHRKAGEHGLVILSMGLAYWMFREDDGYHLWVDREAEEAVREQITRYDKENRGWPRKVTYPPLPRDHSILPLAVLGLVLGFFFLAQQRLPEWFLTFGALDAVKIVATGEWWRTITALSLHVHIAHLVANLVAGGLFGLLVMRGYGSSFGLFVILLSGALGNYATAFFYYPESHYSIGASTMVFGAVGLIVGKAMLVMRSNSSYRAWRMRLIPLGVGFIVLGLYGVGGDNTDVAAHLFGMLAGILLAFPAHWLQVRHLRDSPWQYLFLVAASFLFCAAWFEAIAAGSP